MTFNDDAFSLATALQAESRRRPSLITWSSRPHARVVRSEAQKILRTPALLPNDNRAAYKRMLNDFIVVANLLQPGPGYGTTAQDYAAWYKALNASNITVY